jgi:O-methyltransferase domain/Dimerisation domain
MMPDPTAVEDGQPTGEDARKFAELFAGYRVSQSLYVMAELGIADLLRDGPRDSDDLAQATEAHPPTLYRVLRFLAAHGILEEVVPHRFALTSLGTMLRSDVRGSRRASTRMQLQEAQWRPWGHLLQTVRTGETAFDLVHGMTFFERLDHHPEEAVLFSQAMSTVTAFSGGGTAIAYDFAAIGTLVDIGRSQGQLLAAILGRYQHLQGVLFDRPAAISTAPALLAEAGVADRCEIVPGSFFETVPSGGDAYILRHILHDWSDEACVAILKVCRAAVAPESRLLIIERTVASDGQTPLSVLYADLEMLVNVGGQERTRDQYSTLLAAADFRLTDAIPTGEQPPHMIYEAVPA